MAYLPGQQYVQSAAGVWTPVGYASGNLPTPVAARDQNTSRNALVGTFQALNAVPLIGLVNTTFFATTSITDNYTTANTGSATTTVNSGDGFGVLATGTTNPSTAQITSKDFATFNGIGELMFLNGLRAPQVAVAGVVKRWGAYNSTDGYFFEDNGGTFRVVARKQGSDTAIVSGSFNGLLGTTYTLDQNSHFFQILMTGGRAIFMVDQVVLHTYAAGGATSLVGSLNLGIRVEIVSTQTNSHTLEIRGQNIGRLGTVDSKRLNEGILDGIDAELVRSVLTATTGAANTYVNLTAKAASTPAVAADISLVVAVHPTSPLPAGSNALGSVSVSNLPVTQPVSLASAPTTPVTGTFFQGTQPVSGTFFQATQPVSIATNTPDVTDRAARLLGVTTPSLTPTATIGAASGNIGAPYYETNTVIKAAASVIASPGAGLSIYVTDMAGSNEGATASAIVFSEGAATPVRYRRLMSVSGGGFVMNLKTPWKLPANTALWAAVTVATTWNFTINYYIAP